MSTYTDRAKRTEAGAGNRMSAELGSARVTEWVIRGRGRERRGCEETIPAGTHRALAAGLDAYHARNLLEALRLVPDTGDWHGSLRIACQMRLDYDGATYPHPNQTAEQMAQRAVDLAIERTSALDAEQGPT